MNFVKFSTILGVWSLLLVGCDSKNSKEGDQLFSQGKYEEAVSQYSAYIEYNPDDIKSIYNRGRAYEELGEFDKSMDD